MTIKAFAPDFPILINDYSTSVNLYCLDSGCGFLLDRDFVRRHNPLTINSDAIVLHIEGKVVKVACKSDFIIKIFDKQLDPQSFRCTNLWDPQSF